MAFSKKQLEILLFPKTKYTALVCDGAIRSGKTRDVYKRQGHDLFPADQRGAHRMRLPAGGHGGNHRR